jgi:hypothetical protein
LGIQWQFEGVRKGFANGPLSLREMVNGPLSFREMINGPLSLRERVG